MENPVREIPSVIHTLCQGTPDEQHEAIQTYFTPDASFTHPFCRVYPFGEDRENKREDGTISKSWINKTWMGDVMRESGVNSRWVIARVFEWYKIMSPEIELQVHGVAMDELNLQMYVDITQTFRIFCLPGYKAPVRLVTVLQLVKIPKPPTASRGGQIQTRSTVERANESSGPESPTDTAPTGKITNNPFTSDVTSTTQGNTPTNNNTNDLNTNNTPAASSPTTTSQFTFSSPTPIIPHTPSARTHIYKITSQNDLYQTDQFARFLWFGLWRLVVAWQVFAVIVTCMCAVVFRPVGRVVRGFSGLGRGGRDGLRGKGKGKGYAHLGESEPLRKIRRKWKDGSGKSGLGGRNGSQTGRKGGSR